jgi:hypothetical protein
MTMQSCAVFGLAKNVGKTTVIHAMVERAEQDRVTVGLVSIGVDGEERDVWTWKKKPPIRVPVDGWVATASTLLEKEKSNWEWVEETGISSPLGAVIIARARRETQVKLAGVQRGRGVTEVLRRMHGRGVEMALVDGAYDRKTAGNPWLTDGAVAVAGAALGLTVDQVVERVTAWWSVARLPATTSPVYRQAGWMVRETGRMIGVRDGAVIPLSSASLLSQVDVWQRELNGEDWRALAIPGALTEAGLSRLIARRQPLELILSDPTRCFVSRNGLRRWFHKGGRISYLRPLRLHAWAINPISPEGYGLDREQLVERVQAVVHPLPVVDVKREGWPFPLQPKEGISGVMDG